MESDDLLAVQALMAKIHSWQADGSHTDAAVDLLRQVAALLVSRPEEEADNSVVLAAEAYALRCVEATGRGFTPGEISDLKCWFYAGARWRDARPDADVQGPQSSTMTAPDDVAAVLAWLDGLEANARTRLR